MFLEPEPSECGRVTLSYILGTPDQRGRKAGARSRSTEVTKLDLEYRVAWVHRSRCSSSEERGEEKGSFQ